MLAQHLVRVRRYLMFHAHKTASVWFRNPYKLVEEIQGNIFWCWTIIVYAMVIHFGMLSGMRLRTPVQKEYKYTVSSKIQSSRFTINLSIKWLATGLPISLMRRHPHLLTLQSAKFLKYGSYFEKTRQTVKVSELMIELKVSQISKRE